MARAHVYKIIQAPNGDVITDASVLVLQHGTTTPLGATLYANAVGSTTISNPFMATTGVIEFFLDQPTRVAIRVSRPNVDDFTFSTVDAIVAFDPEPAPIELVNTVPNSGSALTLVDNTVATIHRVTLSANVTLTFPTLVAGKSFTLMIEQNATTGGRTVTWPTTVRWPGGTTPTLTSTANRRDIFQFVAIGTNWYGRVYGQNYPV